MLREISKTTTLLLGLSLGYHNLYRNVVKWPNFIIFVYLFLSEIIRVNNTSSIPNFFEIVFGKTKSYIKVYTTYIQESAKWRASMLACFGSLMCLHACVLGVLASSMNLAWLCVCRAS